MSEQLALLPVLDAPTVPALPRRIVEMHRMYGVCEGRQCATCRHLIRVQPGQNTYLKCELTMITRGPGSDWRAGWPACGKWEAR